MSYLAATGAASRIFLHWGNQVISATTTQGYDYGWGDNAFGFTGLPIDDFTLVVERLYFWFLTGSYAGGSTLTTTVDLFKDGTTDKVFNTVATNSTSVDAGTIIRIAADTGDYANGAAGATFAGEELTVRLGGITDTGTARINGGSRGVLVCRSIGS